MTITPVVKLTTPVADSNDPTTFASRANVNFKELNTVLDSINVTATDMDTLSDEMEDLEAALVAANLPSLTGQANKLIQVNGAEDGVAFSSFGSNSNGSWLILGGLQIAYHTIDRTASFINTATGNVFRENIPSGWTFPRAFNSAPVVTALPRGTTDPALSIHINSVSATSVSLILSSSETLDNTDAKFIEVIAIGTPS
jgi:hypothetical protein